MVATREVTDVSVLPPAPRNPLPYRTQLRSLRAFHTGFETLRDAGGPVTRVVLGPGGWCRHWSWSPHRAAGTT